MTVARGLAVAIAIIVSCSWGCNELFIDESQPSVFLSFVQPYPLVGRGCDVQIEVMPVGETPTPIAPEDSCSERPTTGEEGDIYFSSFNFPAGDWTATVFLRSGDCVGSENFTKNEDQPVHVEVELTCQ